MKPKKIRKTKINIKSVLAVILLLVGVLLFFYPTVSNFLAEKNQSKIIKSYVEEISSGKEINLEEEWEKAKRYNENLAGDPVHDPFIPGSGYALPENYLEVLNINGVMGYIVIPKISVNLPIYHGTSEEVMQKGVGHIESTALPIGGDSTHSVITGHRGLPSAELFTRLDELDKDDYFYINVLDKTLTYKIDQIKTILPNELENLQVINGKDFITLVTCTPYGINTHRLLIRAERTEDIPLNEVLEEQEDNKKLSPIMIGILIGIGILIFIIIIKCIIIKQVKRRRHLAKHRK